MTNADGYVSQAGALIAIGRHADAVPLLQRAIAAEPEETYPRCMLAACFIEMGRHADACPLVESAISLEPESSLAHRLHSVALLGLGKRKPALDAAQEAIRLSPSDSDAMLALGEARLENRHYDDAVRSAKAVLALDPGSFEGHYLLGRIALGRKRWKQAEAHCRDALRIEPRNWVVMNNLGVALQGQGRHKESVAAFEDAARLNPRADLVRRNLFNQSQRYIGIGVITVLIVQGLRLAFLTHANVAALPIIGLILLIGAAAVYVIRKRQLSPTVRQFYDLERRRRWPLTIGYLVFWYGGFLLIFGVGFAAYALSGGTSVVLLPMAAGIVGWWFWGPRLWRETIEPRLEPKDQA